jgi:Type ISP C-terminal specificity domain
MGKRQSEDVYLNQTAFWRNILRNVWDYQIGGYQVIKKWLRYRESGILGRPLKPEEAREVTNTSRRIAALVLLQPKLDENYRGIKPVFDSRYRELSLGYVVARARPLRGTTFC